jgi:hypothetical protein
MALMKKETIIMALLKCERVVTPLSPALSRKGRGGARIILAGMLAVCGSAAADDVLAGLPDPTRPPSERAPGQDKTGEGSGTGQQRAGMVLQSTMISRDARSAVINGKTLTEGERIGTATLVAINPFEVTLSQAGREIALRLMPSLAKQRRIPEADNHARNPE